MAVSGYSAGRTIAEQCNCGLDVVARAFLLRFIESYVDVVKGGRWKWMRLIDSRSQCVQCGAA